MRRQLIHNNLTKPGKKARHEKVDVQELIKKSESQYVDFQQISELIPLRDYLEKHIKCKKVFKSDRERKSYCLSLGLNLQRDPGTNQLCVPVHGKNVMLSGTRISAERVKEKSYEDKKESKAAFASAKEGISAKNNSQDSGFWSL